MTPFYEFSNIEKEELCVAFRQLKSNPYSSYVDFKFEIKNMIENRITPKFFIDICKNIKKEREEGVYQAHVLRNCPRDENLPRLNFDNPVADKYQKKNTFIGEAFLELFAQLLENPLLAYADRNNGDFFTDVIAINRYKGQLTGYSDSELVYHNDRAAHKVRADYVTLLGLHIPECEVTYTGYVHGSQILSELSQEHQATLRKPYFITQFDVFSKDTKSSNVESEKHPILEGERWIRYMDTMTNVAPNSPGEAKDALIAFMHALIRSKKEKHRIKNGDLLTFSNKSALHSREKLEVDETEKVSSRWLLKTYSFRNRITADKYSSHWRSDIYGKVYD